MSRLLEKRGVRVAGLAVLVAIGIGLLMYFGSPGAGQGPKFRTEGDALDIRLIGLRPNGGDNVFDLEGHKIGERLNAGHLTQGASKCTCDFIFALPETESPIVFDRFAEVRSAGGKRVLGTSQGCCIETSSGQRQLIVSLTFPITYRDSARVFGIPVFRRKVPVDVVDLTLRYYHGPKRKGELTFSGPFQIGTPVVAKEDGGCSFLVSGYAPSDWDRELRCQLSLGGSGRHARWVTAYDTAGRRRLATDSQILGIPLGDLALVVVNEPMRERRFCNITVAPPNLPRRPYPEYYDRMAKRLGLPESSPDQIEPGFRANSQSVLTVIDVVRGYDHMRTAWEAIRYARPRIQVADLEPKVRERLRSTARTWSRSPNPQAKVWGVEMGLWGGWPEFFELAMDVLGTTCPLGLLSTPSGRWYIPELPFASYSNGFFGRISALVAGGYRDLEPEQIRRLGTALLAARDASTLTRLFGCLLAQGNEAAATDVLKELARDERPWVWMKAIYELGKRDALGPVEEQTSTERQRLVAARAVFGSSNPKERVDAEVVPLLASLVTADAQRMHGATFPFSNVLQAVARHCDRDTATAAYVRFLRAAEPSHTSDWAIDRVVKRINFDHGINLGGLGSDFSRQSSANLQHDYDWQAIVADAVQWHETGQLPGRAAEDTTIALRFPDDHSVGTISVAGSPRLEARGTVRVPRGASIQFSAAEETTDVSFLGQFTSLTVVRAGFHHAKIQDEDLRLVGRIRSLQALELSYTAITDEGLAHLDSLTSLTQIALNNTEITDKGLQALAVLPNLERLDLQQTRVTAVGLEALTACGNVEILMLDGCPIGDDGLAVLKRFPDLYDLSLSATKITDAGLIHLQAFPALANLRIGGTAITDAGMEHLGGLKDLRQLYLNDTEVGDAGLARIAGLTNLTSLNLGKTNVTDAGLKHLAGMSKLNGLTLSNCRITDAGVETLKRLSSLGYLDLRWTGVSQEAMEALEKAVPKCRIMGMEKQL